MISKPNVPMAKKEKQIGNAFIYLLPVAVGNLLPILTLPIFTSILTAGDYGAWALAQVYAVFVTGVANFGLNVGFERNFFEYKETKGVSGLLYSTVLFVIIGLIAFGLITLQFGSELSKWIIGSTDYAAILFFSYCTACVTSLKAYYLTYLKNTENAKAFAWYTIDESLLGVLFSLYMVLYLRIGIVGLVLGQLLAGIIVFSVLSIRFSRSIPISFDWTALKESLKISWPLTPRIFLGIIGNQFDKYMIGQLNTVEGVGIYNIGQKVANTVFTFMTALQNVFSPQVYRRMFEEGEEGGKSVGRYLTPFLYISIFFGLLISIFSEEIITVLTPKSYHGAIEIVSILCMLYGSYFFGKQPQLVYAKKTYITSVLTFASIGINVAVNIPFIYQWGAIGAAWGTFLAGIISGLISFMVSQYFYKIEWEYKSVAKIFLIFFTFSIAVIAMRHYGIQYWTLVLVKLVAVMCYLYLGITLNIISKRNYLILRSVVSPVFNRHS